MPFLQGHKQTRGRRWGGKYAAIREIYFKERTPERMLELKCLINDAEYLISELSRLEKRSCIPSMVSIQLRNLTLQLSFLERYKDFRSERRLINYLKERFNVTEYTIRRVIYEESLAKTWWINEIEAGKELDIYIPPDEVFHPSDKFRFRGKKFEFLTKQQLIYCVEELSRRLEDKRGGKKSKEVEKPI